LSKGRKSILALTAGGNDIFMDPVRLNPEKTGICAQQNRYFVLSWGNWEEILRFHHITGIDRIHSWNQLHLSGRRHVQLRAPEGTGRQFADSFPVHINVKGSEQLLFLPLLGIDPNLPFQFKRNGKRFPFRSHQREKQGNTE